MVNAAGNSRAAVIESTARGSVEFASTVARPARSALFTGRAS